MKPLKFALAVRINGSFIILSLHPTQEAANQALATSPWRAAAFTTAV